MFILNWEGLYTLNLLQEQAQKEIQYWKNILKCSIDCDDRNIMVTYLFVSHMFLSMGSIEQRTVKAIDVPV